MKKITEVDAMAVMFGARLMPLTPFPGANTPWPCWCWVCGNSSSPRYSAIKLGTGCRRCGHKVIKDKLRLTPDMVYAAYEAKQFFVLGDYVRANDGILSIHIPCGALVSPSYSSLLRATINGACSHCAPEKRGRTKMLNSDAVERLVQGLGWTPLAGSFPRLNEPWTMLHRCGVTSSPRLADIRRSGGDGCSNCANHGFSNSKPAWLYFIYHPRYEVYKIGKTNNLTQRLRRHAANGWKMNSVVSWRFEIGQEAADLEQKVLQTWRTYPQTSYPRLDGYTETISECGFTWESLEAHGLVRPKKISVSVQELTVRIASRSEVASLVVEGHYLHSMPPSIVSVGLFDSSDKILGAAVFSRATYSKGGVWLWDGPPESMVELRRFYLVDSLGENSESWFLARAMRLLSPDIEMVVAYTSPDAGHYGACYQASNFLYFGTVSKGSYYYESLEGRRIHKRTVWGRARRRGVSETEYVATAALTRVEEAPKGIYAFRRGRSHNFKLSPLPYPKPDRSLSNPREPVDTYRRNQGLLGDRHEQGTVDRCTDGRVRVVGERISGHGHSSQG